MPISIFTVGYFFPAQFSKTYYGQLEKMYKKLYNIEGKKIVVLGNSAVAFGVDAGLMEEELQTNDMEYSVCNFGLYGALGTKMMLDLSLDAIGEGDVVIFMPELIPQSMSLYFSAEHAWRGLDQNQTMFTRLPKENQAQLVGSYAGFVAEKWKYYFDGGAQASGIYSADSFDQNCDMKNYSRKENIMQNACDSNNIFNFDASLLNVSFVEYVNKYFACIREKGATMYFYCAPINERAITQEGRENIDVFFQAVYEVFDFPLMGNPHESIMQAEWFYDANVHLNEYGMTVFTANLTNALKTRFGDSSLSSIVIPAMPSLPENEEEVGEGDNSDVSYFQFEENEKGEMQIIGLTELGATKTRLVLPWSVDGKKITGFSKDVFANNKIIKEIVIQENIRRLENGCFDGCSSLKSIYLKHMDPAKLSISTDTLLDQTDNAVFYVSQEVYAAFVTNYYWGYYAKSIRSWS